MGVPKFYRWISERYPSLSEVINDDQIPEFDNLYLDMNGIIHSCSHPDDENVLFRISEQQIFQDIFHYIDVLFGIIKPKKVFFMAVDGVAPRAKMNQQRARRFMSSKNAEASVKKAINKGIEIPKEKAFDSNCITPGTQFMARLHHQLQYFIQMKITTDSCWQGLRIYFSGHNCPGEGEHKIMDFIRSERSRPDYDSNTRHCLYGLDADLIMLGMCSHEPHFALLREEVRFSRPHNQSTTQRTGVDETKFHLLHLSLLREYLSWEFNSLKTTLPFEFNLESVIDDWVLMGFLVGNDFIPHLPYVHIHEDALPLLYTTYIEVLPQLDGYINEAGILNLRRFEIFLKNFAKNDRKVFIERMDDEAYLASKRTSNAWKNNLSTDQQNNDDGYDLEPFDFSDVDVTEFKCNECHKGAFDSDSNFSEECTEPTASRILRTTKTVSHGYFGLDKNSDDEQFVADILLNDENYENDCDVAWTPSVSRAFKNHKRDYYNDKMNYDNISKEELREQAEGYVRAVQWNLHYYYHGCCSWSWFYPHHYAPYISDVTDFSAMEMNFDLSQPFRPFEQLLAVLPAASSDCLPPPFQELMCDPKSPIIDFYPLEFDIDLNGKKNDWEAVVLIPFINEDRLLKAVALKEPSLNDEERQRNSHGPHLLFTYDPESMHLVKSLMPDTFPDIQECTAKVQEIGMDEFRIPRSQVVHGLLPGVQPNVVFPGFPTMKHLPHTAELQFANIRVFQQHSKKKSMILKISKRPEFEKDVIEIAFDLIGTEVHVNWPLLRKAKVQELWTADEKYSKKEEEEIVCDKLSEEEQNLYSSYVMMAQKNEFERRGIDAGEQKGLALVRLVCGSEKCFEEGRIVNKLSYAEPYDAVPVSLSLILQNLSENLDAPYSNEDAFPIDAKIFISSAESKYYGFIGCIKENNLAVKGTLTVSCTLPSVRDVNFLDLIIDRNRFAMKWYSIFELSKILDISTDVINRITGTVLVCPKNSANDKNCYTKKVNIGLELKFLRKNLTMPDYARRSLTGYWLYSSKTLDLIKMYIRRFPEVFEYLHQFDSYRECILVENLFPESNKQRNDAKFEELKQFLRSNAPKDPLDSADGIFLDSSIVKEVEKRIEMVLNDNVSKQVYKRLAVKPRAVFRAELCKGDVTPDPKSEYRLLDRVVCVKKLPALYGEFGTVVGLLKTEVERKVDVLFDKPYIGGKIMRSSKASGARLPVSSLINITHGKRVRKEIPMTEHVLKSKTIHFAIDNSGHNRYTDEEYQHDESYVQKSAGRIKYGFVRNAYAKNYGHRQSRPYMQPVYALHSDNSLHGGVSGLHQEQFYSAASDTHNTNFTRNNELERNQRSQDGRGQNRNAQFGNKTNVTWRADGFRGDKLMTATNRVKIGRFPGGGSLSSACHSYWESSKAEIATPPIRNFGSHSTFPNFTESANFSREPSFRNYGNYNKVKSKKYLVSGVPENINHRQMFGHGNFSQEKLRSSKAENVSNETPYSSDKNMPNRFAGKVPSHRESEGNRRNKLHHGYPRAWFGSKPPMSKEHPALHPERMNTEFAQMSLAEKTDKKYERVQPQTPITILKRGELVNPKLGNFVPEAVKRTVQLFDEEKVSSELDFCNQATEGCSSNAELESVPHVQMNVVNSADVSKCSALAAAQEEKTGSSVSKDLIHMKTEENSLVEVVALNERKCQLKSANVNETNCAEISSDAGTSNNQGLRPRKSRVAANFGFRKRGKF